MAQVFPLLILGVPRRETTLAFSGFLLLFPPPQKEQGLEGPPASHNVERESLGPSGPKNHKKIWSKSQNHSQKNQNSGNLSMVEVRQRSGEAVLRRNGCPKEPGRIKNTTTH